MKILILGANGMIGHTMFRILSQKVDWQIFGVIRGNNYIDASPGSILNNIDLRNPDNLPRIFQLIKPNVVINCAGLTKHLPDGNFSIPAIAMNSLLPHRLSEICTISGSRLVHVSTDCVFSGKKGNYLENDCTDAMDLYGKTKALGEVIGSNMLTLRTSTIGHENGTRLGLLEWFLSRMNCKGYRRAIFSGLTTVEFAIIVRDIVIPNSSLSGIYHVGGDAIDKFSLLNIIKNIYQKDIFIEDDCNFHIDRSLNSKKFLEATGYRAPSWTDLIKAMHKDYVEGNLNNV